MTEDDQTRVLQIGDLVLDTGTRELRRGSQTIELPKLSFRLVQVLAEAAPNVVPAERLIEEVWSGRVVSPETLTQRIKLVRQALGDDASSPHYIGLVRGEGYRMLADVGELPPAPEGFPQQVMAELGRRRVLQVALIYAAAAWIITEILSFLIASLPVFPQWSQALVAILFVVGFPIAMFLAWRFDLGTDGVRRVQATTAKSRLTLAAAMLLLIGATGGLFYLIYPRVIENVQEQLSRQNVTVEANTVAVLPFVHSSTMGDDLYMSAGLGDNLRDQLGRISGLRVSARTSSVIFSDQTVDATEIAARLGVAKLVEGTFSRQDEQLYVSVKIIDGASGFQDWAQTYEKDSGDLLLIQQEIAADVVAQMLPEADPQATAATVATFNATANDFMLLAGHAFQQVRDQQVVNLELLLRAISLYEKATVADPDSALAHSRLGEAQLYLGDVEAAEKPIFRALALNSDLSEVQNTLGLYYWLRFLPGSGDAHLRALELNPNNADALSAYGKWLWHQQVTGDSEGYFLRALKLDPMALTRYTDLGNFYGISGQRDKALDIARQIESRFVDAAAYLVIARIHELTGDLDIGIAWALKARNLDPDYKDAAWMLAELYARIGDFESSRVYEPEDAFNVLYWERRYPEMIERGEELVFEQPNQIQIWYGLARAYAATGRYDQAIYVLQSRGLPDNVFVDSRRANGVEALTTLADVLKASGRVELARDYATWLEPMFQRLIDTGSATAWWPHLYLACVNSILDKDEEALRLLSLATGSPGLLWYPVLTDSICFRKFSNEPRYLDAVATMEKRQAELRERLPLTLQRIPQTP